MKFKNITRIVLLAVITTGLISCKDGNSVFDPEYEPSEPDPIITSISPEGGYLAGVDSVIVSGENFASDFDSLIIDFGGSPGVIKRASRTELVVRPGMTTGENLNVRVATRGAVNFSSSFQYSLSPAVKNHPGLSDNYRPLSAIAIDTDESVYGFINIQGDVAFRKITSDGFVSTYSTTRFSNYSSVKFGPDGAMYLLTPQTPNAAIFRIPSGGNPAGDTDQVWAFPPISERANFVDLTFDDDNYIWVVGNNEDIYRFSYPGGEIQRFNFTANLRSVFVYENYLYVAGTQDGSSDHKIWRFPIDANNNLGDLQEVFNYSSKYGSGIIRAINFDNSGNMYLGIVNGEHGIIRIESTGKNAPFYPYVLSDSYYALIWDEQGNIIGARQSGENGSLLLNKIDTFDKERAPVYGFN